MDEFYVVFGGGGGEGIGVTSTNWVNWKLHNKYGDGEMVKPVGHHVG